MDRLGRAGLSYWAVLQGLGLRRTGLVGTLLRLCRLRFVRDGLRVCVDGAGRDRGARRGIDETNDTDDPAIGGGMALVSTILLRFVWFVSELAISVMLYGARCGKDERKREVKDDITAADAKTQRKEQRPLSP